MLGRHPGGGNGHPLHYSCLENSMDIGTWWATVHGGHKESDTTERLTTHTARPVHRCCRSVPLVSFQGISGDSTPTLTQTGSSRASSSSCGCVSQTPSCGFPCSVPYLDRGQAGCLGVRPSMFCHALTGKTAVTGPALLVQGCHEEETGLEQRLTEPPQ